MKAQARAAGIEINPKFVGAFFTEQIENKLRVFCYFTNGGTSQFELAADENLDNLHSFHSKLNMDETCSSVIHDEVVQGRVYVHAGEICWLYTLLSTPGEVLPQINGDICDLPWRYCWRSLAADVLEYGKPGDSVHCFAIRTQISENDASRLVKDAKAFINPLPLKKKASHALAFVSIGTALVLLVTLIAGTAFYTSKQRANGSFNSRVVSVETAEPATGTYYLLYKHKIAGPYPVKIIASMNSGGLLAPETMCRPEKSTEWANLATLLPPQLAR